MTVELRICDLSSDVCSSDLARFSTGKYRDGAWEDGGIEKLASGTWQLVISEIPYGVAKGKLIEAIAQLIADKKLPILEDVRDESAEDIRSEEHTSELQSLMRISYAVFCLKKKKRTNKHTMMCHHTT